MPAPCCLWGQAVGGIAGRRSRRIGVRSAFRLPVTWAAEVRVAGCPGSASALEQVSAKPRASSAAGVRFAAVRSIRLRSGRFGAGRRWLRCRAGHRYSYPRTGCRHRWPQVSGPAGSGARPFARGAGSYSGLTAARYLGAALCARNRLQDSDRRQTDGEPGPHGLRAGRAAAARVCAHSY